MGFLPDVDFAKPVQAASPAAATAGRASRPTLRRAAQASDPARQQVLQLAPAGKAARIVLGRARLGADVFNALDDGTWFLMQCIWGWAPAGLDAIESITYNDRTWPSYAQVTHYTGGAGNIVDPWLQAAFAAKGHSFADTLPGSAYSVVRIPLSTASSDGLPQIAAVVRGHLCYDPRSDTWGASSNAALLLANYLSDPSWGLGYTMDWASVAGAADVCDETVGGAPRHTLNLALDQPTDDTTLLQTLAEYAGVFVAHSPAGVKLIPNRPVAAPLPELAWNSDPRFSLLKLGKRARRDAPTRVRVHYTDTTQVPWRYGPDVYAEWQHPDLATGGVELIHSDIPMPGIHDYSEALRLATERGRQLTLSDLTAETRHYDAGVALEIGDVYALTHVAGLAAKPMRIVGIDSERGRYEVAWSEYDPAAFSDATGTAPSYPDTNLADPNRPPPPSALTVTEELFQTQGDKTSSRIKAVIGAAADFPWVDHYRVKVVAAGEVVWTDTVPPGDVFRSGSLAENVFYTVNAYTVSRSGAVSTPISKTITAQGKQLPPTDVQVMTGFETGGEVFLTIGAVLDIDLKGLEVRYGATGVLWDAAKFLDFKPAASGVGAVVRSNIVPEGTFDFLSCGRDSGGRYSANPKRLTLTVTKDDKAFLVEEHSFDGTPTLTLMSEARLRRGGPVHWITDAGDDMNYGFTDPDPATGDYSELAGQPFSAPRSGGTAIWQSTVWDVGVLVSGNWAIEADIAIQSGTVDVILSLSEDGQPGNWADHTGIAHKATGRFVQLRIEGDGVWQLNGPPTVRIDAVPRTETGSITCSAAGPVTVTLDGKGAFVKSIKLTLVGQPPGSALYDNVQIAGDGTITFDLERFDSNDARLGGVPLDWEANYL